MYERKLTEQELVRRDKALKLRELGYDPFGSRYDREDYANDVIENYAGVGYWESHVSELNESEYVSTHEKFLDFLYHADLTSHYIDIQKHGFPNIQHQSYLGKMKFSYIGQHRKFHNFQ